MNLIYKRKPDWILTNRKPFQIKYPKIKHWIALVILAVGIWLMFVGFAHLALRSSGN